MKVQWDLLPGIGMVVLCVPTPTWVTMRIYPDLVGIFHATLAFSPTLVTFLLTFGGQRCGIGVVGVVGVIVCGRGPVVSVVIKPLTKAMTKITM